MTLPELRRIAEAATPGPWVESTTEDWSTDKPMEVGEGWIDGVVEYGECGMHLPKWSKPENLAYVLTFNPQTVIKLLDAIEIQKNAIDTAWRLIDVLEGVRDIPKETVRKPAEFYERKASECLSGLEMK